MAGLMSLDELMLRAILELPRPPWLIAFVDAASMAATFAAIWVALALLLTLLGEIRPAHFLRLIVALALVHVTVDVVLKPLIGRPRPPHALEDLQVSVTVPESRSFPSGHAANAVAAGVFLTAVWTRRSARLPLWCAVFVVAAARVFLGIHYPLDALAGSAVGALCAWAVLHVPPARSG
jgi:undecaprenyl-diphosphatase